MAFTRRALTTLVPRALPDALKGNIMAGGGFGGPAIIGAGSWLDELRAVLGNGRSVSAEAALSIAAYFRAISIISGVAGTMPLHVNEKAPDGRRSEVTTEATRFVWGRPNREVTKAVFWMTVYTHLSMHGNAYLYVVTGSGRRPVELYPIEPKRVRVGRTPEGVKVYEIDQKTPAKDFDGGGEVVHFQGFGTDGLKGLSPVQLFRKGLGLALDTEDSASKTFENMSAPTGGYLSTDQPLTPAQSKALSEVWEEYHRGPEAAHRVAVLGSGTKWLTTSLKPEDLQMFLARGFQVAEVSRMTGVPEHLLGSHDKQSSWGTGIAENNRGLLTYTIDPFIVIVEQTISDELLPPNQYVKVAREGLLRGTPLEQAQYLEIMRRNKVINADEWRELMDMAPLPAGQGQVYENPNTSKGDGGNQNVPAAAPVAG